MTAHVHHHHLSPGQRRWRRAKRAVITLIAVSLIGAAAAFGGCALALPWLVSHPERVREFLSEKLGRPVSFTNVHASWHASGPVFALDQVEIDDPAGRAEPFRIARAELAVDVYTWFHRYGSFTEFRLDGLDIDATYGADGQWHVARLAADSSGDQNALLDLGAVSLRNSRIAIHDERDGSTLKLERIDLRLVNLSNGRHVGGLLRTSEESPPLRFACNVADDFVSGRCYVGGRQLDVTEWLGKLPMVGLDALSGKLDLGLWMDWDHGPAAVQIEAQAHECVLRGLSLVPIGKGELIEPRAHFEELGLAARWRREDDGWRIDAKGWHGREKDGNATMVALLAHGAGDERRFLLDAPRVMLDDWLPLLAVARGLPDSMRGWLYQAAPRGVVQGLDARWDAAGSLDADAQFSGLAFGGSRHAPGVETLNGRLLADEHALVMVAAPEQKIRVDFPHVFRAPIEFRLHSLTLAALREADGIRFEATDLDLGGEGLSAHGRASWLAPEAGGSPQLDLTLALGEGEVTAGRLFWPVNVIPPGTVAWLDRALAGGKISGGNVVFYGPVEDFPFRNHSGRFDARASVRDVDFDFNPNWPRARIGSAELAFVDNTMDIVADGATVMGNEAGPATAHIGDTANPNLELKVRGSGSGADLLGLIRASPIRGKVGDFLDGLKLGGHADVAFDLFMPLNERRGDSKLTGSVTLVDSDVANPQWGLGFTRANGELKFTDHGLVAQDMQLDWNEQPSLLNLATGEFAADHSHDVEVRLRGLWPAGQIFGGFALLAPHLARIEGKSNWEIDFSVAPPDAAGARAKRVAVRSDLRGTRLDLPVPLAKPADAALPLELALDWPLLGSPIELGLGDVLHLKGRLASNDKPFVGVLAFGNADPGPLPELGLRVRGETPSLDLGEWAGLGGGGDGSLAEVDLNVAALKASGRNFGATHINLATKALETQLKFEGKNLDGQLSWTAANLAQRGVSARFNHLVIPAAEAGAGALKSDPARLPPLHLWAKDFRIGSANLGEARLESYPHGDGMHIEHFETGSENLELRAQGDWTLSKGTERSDFDISFTAQDLGKLLDALGFSGMVADGPTYVHINGVWDGAPGDFSLARIDGTLEGKVGAGRILEVDPGAGRFFGLINLQAIPRRLALDFSDFFQTGMSFDSIEGKFVLKAGDAHTDDTVLSAPSAVIKISGRTGLAKRDYDQELDVTPKVGGVLPWVGALAGGPAGAAAGLLVQNMLSKPLRNASRARYHVTGSWEKPEINLIARDRPPLSQAENEQARRQVKPR